ncbi:MAG: hypothetical protein AVDCRST_MAG56-1068 [uncultured Cytophagales bacterium]|uniref:DUF7793 domain-containing protein n=1 Tax=uncultured Cytophagales bacterium TaxID=158755 RepID=A0A6J4HVQ0_9SPHI|nr:MAG: hypothetical protein AVDCRST_MAG56-1068 [uncultured Cytophagales bacterium]
MHTDYFINIHWKLWIESDVLHVKAFAENINLEIVQRGVDERVKLCGNVAYPMLSDGRKVKHLSKEARAFLASPESTVLVSAGAFLVSNQLQKVLGNFFILIDKPEIPTRLFTDESEALNWLQQFKNIRSTA